jgi:hypothetical protein
MILLDKEKYVINISEKIEIVNEQGEENLIKVWIGESFFYYATEDRFEYEIVDATPTIQTEKRLKYIDGEFIECD